MAEQLNLLSSKLRKALAQLPYLPRALALVWEVARGWTVAWLILLIVQGLLPALAVYLTKLVVDGIVQAVRAGSSWPASLPVLKLVVALGGIMLLMEVVRSGINWIRAVQAELLKDHITNLIHTKAVSADLAFYERSDYYDRLHRARSEAGHRPVALLENIGALLQNGITLLAMGAILIPLGPWLALALLLSTLPALYVVVHYALAEYQWRQRTTADERRIWYYDWIMTTVESAAELRLFGLGQHFQAAYRTLRKRLRTDRLALTYRQSIAELLASLIALLVVSGAMAWMVWRAINSSVTLGELALIYAAFNQGQRLMRTLLENLGQFYANSLFLGNLFEFLALQPVIGEVSDEDGPAIDRVRQQICFENVSFRYHDSTSPALQSFDLKIPAGRIVAIVGPNGAGKSTLVKLLCRFYDPDEGKIRIDDIALEKIPTRQLRRLISVLFQQPFHYNTTIRENIEYGDIELEVSENDILAAIDAAGAREIVDRLPGGYETLLGKWFNGGTELSVGEWQRIALARAFLRRAQIIILDEPTSALDPWAEADWLQRFRELANGRTAVVITHRFTTAMHADVIHVMVHGRIVEAGSHAELLELGGMYAQSWSRQMQSVETSRPLQVR